MEFLRSCKSSRIITSSHPASIELLYDATSDGEVFACGYYELDEETGTRCGSIQLCNTANNSSFMDIAVSSGVLDMKWNRSNNFLVAALSSGSLKFVHIDNYCNIRDIIMTDNRPEEGLFLSVDVTEQSTISSLAVSTQSGSILSYYVGESELRSVVEIPKAHDMLGEPMPVWIVAMNHRAPDILVSGGDDMKMKLWDLRAASTAQVVVPKVHTAGVTSAMFHPYRQDVFATGSYDEHLRIWDARQLRTPINTINTGKITVFSLMLFLHLFH